MPYAPNHHNSLAREFLLWAKNMRKCEGDKFVKTVVLLIGHGSRDEEGNEEFLRFVDELQCSDPEQTFVACFLEFANPDIAAGIDACVERGATRVLAVPIILLAASHVKLEIPDELDEARHRYPQLEIVYGRNIGLHERLLDLLVERFHELTIQNNRPATGSPHPDSEGVHDMAIVLMGRGSSDPDANGDVYKIARILWERTGVSTVETCFTGITDPRLPTGVERAVRLGARRVIVIPYFLFTGVLIKRMTNLILELRQRYPQITLQMAEYFGLHDILREVVLDRVREAERKEAAMNCDFCKYRREVNLAHSHEQDAVHLSRGEVQA